MKYIKEDSLYATRILNDIYQYGKMDVAMEKQTEKWSSNEHKGKCLYLYVQKNMISSYGNKNPKTEIVRHLTQLT
jgi:hypothetical protein